MHPLTRANYLASPPLVVAYALAGTVCMPNSFKCLLYVIYEWFPVFVFSIFSCCLIFVIASKIINTKD